MKLTPEKRAARAMSGRLFRLAKEIADESGASGVRITADYTYHTGQAGVLKLKLFVSKDAKNERGRAGKVQPDGTTMLAEVMEIARKKLDSFKGA